MKTSTKVLLALCGGTIAVGGTVIVIHIFIQTAALYLGALDGFQPPKKP